MFNKRSVTITTATGTDDGSIDLGAPYGRVHGFRALLSGTDTAVRVRLMDADSRVFYLDAADKDYKTAAVDKTLIWDDTATGLSTTPLDATGAAASAGSSTQPPIVRSPIAVRITNGGTATDTILVTLYYEV